MLSNKSAKIFIIIGATVIALIFAAWQILWFLGWSDSNTIAYGIKISGCDVGGYEFEAAKQKLYTCFQNDINEKVIVISYDDISSTLNESIFTEYEFDQVLEKSVSVARSGNATADYLALVKSKLFGISLDAKIMFNETALESKLNNASQAYFIEAHNAYIVSFDPVAPQGQRLSIVSQIKGQELDILKTAESVKDAVISGQNKAFAYVAETDADITDEILFKLDSVPVRSEYTIIPISPEYEAALYQAIGSGRYEILLPGQEIRIIEYMDAEEYIYFEMPDGGTGSNYEKILTQLLPTQIYIASVLSEIDVTERKMYDLTAKSLPAGTSCITNQYNDMRIRNSHPFPIIIRVGYEKQGYIGQIYCEIYRPEMEHKTLLRSVINEKENKTLIDITRVYVDNIGNTVDSVVVDTVEVGNNKSGS